MITEDQVEQLAISWLQEGGWSYAKGPVLEEYLIGRVEIEGHMVRVIVDKITTPPRRIDPQFDQF